MELYFDGNRLQFDENEWMEMLFDGIQLQVDGNGIYFGENVLGILGGWGIINLCSLAH